MGSIGRIKLRTGMIVMETASYNGENYKMSRITKKYSEEDELPHLTKGNVSVVWIGKVK